RILLAAGGNFLTVVPSIMLDVGLRQLPIRALPIELNHNRRPVAIITLKDRVLSPVAELFIEHTRAVAKAMSRVRSLRLRTAMRQPEQPQPRRLIVPKLHAR